MGMVIDGQWHEAGFESLIADGRFQRKESVFRNWITPDGAPGPSGEGGFKAEPGRYHLYVSLACPWAHRTLIMRKLKGLTQAISVSTTHWLMREQGWTFTPGRDVTGDPINGAKALYEVYTPADPGYTGRSTVPILWDRQRRTIVSNESAEIIRMLNTAFDGVGAAPGDYYPEHLRPEIDALNERIYATVNNGVYRAGFATTQAAYEEAVAPLFESLDWLEAKLSASPFLTGETLTEADVRLFPTLIRFDSVYHGHFKCNLRRIVDYPALWRFTKAIYHLPGVAETVNLFHIKNHYYGSHQNINPTGIVPAGPVLDFGPPPTGG